MKIPFTAIIIAMSVTLAGSASAIPSALLKKIFKTASKVSDDVALDGADDLAKQISKSEKFTHTVEELGSGAKKSNRLKSALKAELGNADPKLHRQIDRLSKDELSTIVLIKNGGQAIRRSVPDILTRGRLINEGGSDLALAAVRHGDEFTSQAVLIDSLASMGKLPKLINKQSTVRRFSSVMNKEGAWKFYRKYVAPNKKKWLAGGLLTAYLVEPEIFHDTAGKITEEGAKKVSQLAGAVVSGGLQGAGEGGQVAGKAVWASFYSSYLTGKWAWASWLGLGVFIYLLGLLIPRSRHLLLSPIHFLMKKSHPENEK